MSAETPGSSGRRKFLISASAAVLIGCAIVGYGLMARAQSKQEVAIWTDQQSVPTVALAGQISIKPTQPLTLPGSIQPLNKAAIFARVNGYVRSWDHDIGTPVRAGQVLASIDAPDLDQQLSQAKANLASVKASLQIANLTANRNNVLVEKQVVAQQMADQTNADAKAKAAVVAANEANVRQLEVTQSFKTLTAPFDGVVTARNVELGMLISSGGSGQPLFEVSDLHRVRIYVQVPQAFSADLKPGVTATFELPQYPGQMFKATLTHISQSFGANSHTMQVELQADNTDGKFYGGSYCTVHFQIPTSANLVQIPSTALVISNAGTKVATVDVNNKVAIKNVNLGRDFGDSVEILAGLSISDRVINNPPETISEGEQVRVDQPQSQTPTSQSVNASATGKSPN
ncbi:MAG: efflux RND transporter periplasmic adaptor subunit [Pseudomonadota bacterium]